ncbi:hypothetical protein K9L05_03725 [Candidatus Babeliales bacterium]|nr:hypothetical protein [Candidatus Babeliales bacterium]MCF7899727.1 hypothetical protein [Candidatus Babeliales bacterium]
MKNFTKQNKLFFIKKFIFCLFFIFSFQNIFAMQEEIDLTKYAHANIADPRIEAQFLKVILETQNNLSGSNKAIMQKLHDRLQSILNKKKENCILDEGDLRETQNTINIAIKRNLINPNINEIYERIKNLRKDNFNAFENIVMPDQPIYEQQIPAQASDFNHEKFKKIFQNLEREHNEALRNLKNLSEKGTSFLSFFEARIMYKDAINRIKLKLDSIKEEEENNAKEAIEIFYIHQEYKKMSYDIEQKDEFFKNEAIRIEQEALRKKNQEQKEKRKQQYHEDAKFSLKTDPVIQELLTQFEKEKLIFLEKAEKYKSPFYSLDYVKTKNDFLKIRNEIEAKIYARSSEIRITSSFIRFDKISNDESIIINELWDQYDASVNILFKNESIRQNKQRNLAIITTTIVLTVSYVAYYTHNKNKECKQDLEIILNKLKNKLSQEKIDQFIKKRSAFFQKYLPTWTKRMFGMQYDWKKYLNKISKLSQEELDNFNF